MSAGSTSVTGTSLPNEVACVEIYACAPGNCTVGSATLIGGPVDTDASGMFTAPVPPLEPGTFIFAYDRCTGRTGPLVPVRVLSTEAPAMSSRMTGVLAGALALIGLFGLLRLRRDL